MSGWLGGGGGGDDEDEIDTSRNATESPPEGF